MANVVLELEGKKLIAPPRWLGANVHYLTIMGSVAYGVSGDTSDMDVYGFCIPPKEVIFPHLAGEIVGFGEQKQRFNQWQQHHVKDAQALAGNGREYDLTVYNIVDYFQLLMKNNPNMIDSIFTHDTCVLHVTRLGSMVRERRKLFLHKGCWHTFKGYAYAQMKKIRNKERESSARREMIEKFGFDCYLDSETEFLTDRGWSKYDDVTQEDLLAVVHPTKGDLGWERYTERVAKPFTGPCYVVEPAMTRCVVTPNHHMLVSPARRSPATDYSYRFFEDKAEWKLAPLSELATGSRSWFHTRRRVNARTEEYPGVTDDYLALAGLYVSEGSMAFYKGKVKSAALCQTPNGKAAFYEAADRLMGVFGFKRYTYAKQTTWHVPRRLAETLYADFGHGSRVKRLPRWCLRLSVRQADVLWKHACLGDGTPSPNGEVYSTVNAGLAGDFQAALTSAGVLCSVRGPYRYEYEGGQAFGETDSYQVYRPSSQYAYACVDFKSRILRCGDESHDTWPIKERQVVGERVVCFQVPSGTLITRSKGQVALHGNTKFAYHVVRLLNEAEQILTEGDLDLMRNREQLKEIRSGLWTEEQLADYFARKEAALEEVYARSELPWGPDEPAIKELLLNVLEEHYGSLDECVVRQDAVTVALRKILDAADEARKALERAGG